MSSVCRCPAARMSRSDYRIPASVVPLGRADLESSRRRRDRRGGSRPHSLRRRIPSPAPALRRRIQTARRIPPAWSRPALKARIADRRILPDRSHRSRQMHIRGKPKTASNLRGCTVPEVFDSLRSSPRRLCPAGFHPASRPSRPSCRRYPAVHTSCPRALHLHA